MRPLEEILSRIERVNRRGDNQWYANCPAHEDRSPSLSIAEGTDGRVLLYCFAGCRAASVIEALGLTLADLFPAPITNHAPVTGIRHRHNPADLLRILDYETNVVATAAANMLNGVEFSDDDFARLAEARTKIERCRAAI